MRARPAAAAQEAFESLTAFGPFPEPVLAQDARRARIWRRERIDAVVREDLRDLSRITELDRVQMLAALLPERVGSLLSVQALREDLEVAHETARRWLTALAEVYDCFEVKPFTRGVRRSVRKEDVAPAPAFRTFAHRLGCPIALQLVATPGVRTEHDVDGTRVVVISAADALSRQV